MAYVHNGGILIADFGAGGHSLNAGAHLPAPLADLFGVSYVNHAGEADPEKNDTYSWRQGGPAAVKVRCRISPANLPCPMPSVTKAVALTRQGVTQSLNPGTLTSSGEVVTIAADDVVLLHLQ